MENVNKSRSTSRLSMRGYFRDLNPDCGGSFDHHDYQQFLWQHPCIRVLSLVKLPVIGVFFSARMFSQPRSNYCQKTDQKNFQLESFQPLFCSKCRKEWNHTSHLVFFHSTSLPCIFNWCFLGEPRWFLLVFDPSRISEKLGKDGLPSESFFAKSLFKNSGVCVKKKNTDSQIQHGSPENNGFFNFGISSYRIPFFRFHATLCKLGGGFQYF